MVLALFVTLVFGLVPGIAAEADPVDVQTVDGVAVKTPVADAAVSSDGVTVDPLLLPDATVPLPELGLGPDDPADDAQTPGPQGTSPSALDHLLPDSAPARTAAGASILAGLAALGWAILRAAGLAPLLPFFSRIEDGELARHPARRQALDFIAANPGCNLQELRHALGLAWGTTVHHMARLEKAGLVAVRHIAGQRTHWPIGGAPPAAALPATSRALASLVQARPGLDQGELARLLGVGAATACKQLARLESAGLVLAQRVGRSRRYVGTARLAATPML